jgi:hypothetical protein
VPSGYYKQDSQQNPQFLRAEKKPSANDVNHGSRTLKASDKWGE